MRRALGGLLILAATAGPAGAQAVWFSAEVVHTEGRWTTDGSRIVTNATLRLADGTSRVVSQLGGHADGYTMVVWDDQVPLEPGLRVRVAAHAGTTTWVADDVILLDGGTRAPSVRTVTRKSATPLYWAKSCSRIIRGVEGTSAVAGDGEQATMLAALATWNTAVGGCSFLDLADGGTEDREVGKDFVNVIKIRDARWCRPPVDGDDERCFNAQAAGVTTVTFVDDPEDERDGEIVDADIELNNVTFRLTVNGQGTGTAACDADLSNTLVHELGHLLGLEHTCRGPGDPARVDHTGAAVPLCTETSDPVITEATMYPFQMCGETKKSSPEPDDVQGICGSHPLADDPGACEPPDELGGGCCGTSRGGASAAALALVVLGLVGGRRGGRRGARLSARLRRSAPRP